MKKLLWSNPKDLSIVINLLQSENLLLGTSDTVLGLLVKASYNGAQQLNAIKERKGKPYILLVARYEDIYRYIDTTILRKGLVNVMQKYWPGPLTLILPVKNDAPDYMKAENGTIAFRVPDHEELRTAVAQVGLLFSTSANKSGQPVPFNISDVHEDIISKVAAYVHQEGKDGVVIPSTIIDCSTDIPKVIRSGVVPVDEILQYLQNNQ